MLQYIAAVALIAFVLQMKTQKRPLIEDKPAADFDKHSNFVTLKLSEIFRENFWQLSICFFVPLSSVILEQTLSLFEKIGISLNVISIVRKFTLAANFMNHLNIVQLASLNAALFLIAYAALFVLIKAIELFLTLVFAALNKIVTASNQTKKKSSEASSFSYLALASTLFVLLTGVTVNSGVGLLSAVVLQLLNLISYEFACRRLQLRIGATNASTKSRIHVTINFLLLVALVPSIPLIMNLHKSDYKLLNLHTCLQLQLKTFLFHRDRTVP